MAPNSSKQLPGSWNFLSHFIPNFVCSFLEAVTVLIASTHQKMRYHQIQCLISRVSLKLHKDEMWCMYICIHLCKLIVAEKPLHGIYTNTVLLFYLFTLERDHSSSRERQRKRDREREIWSRLQISSTRHGARLMWGSIPQSCSIIVLNLPFPPTCCKNKNQSQNE